MTNTADEPAPVRKRRWILRIAGIILSLMIVLAIVVTVVGNRLMDQADRRIAELLKEAKSRPSARPVLYGESAPGNAWDDYTPALADVKAKKMLFVLLKFTDRKPDADRAAVETVLSGSQRTLELLHQGAHKGSAQFPFDWEEGDATDGSEVLSPQIMVLLVVSRARILREQGKSREAMEALLDAAQFGRDIGHNLDVIHEMIGRAVMAIPLEELRDQVASKEFSREDIARLERSLETLEGALPLDTQCLLNESLYSQVFIKRGYQSHSAWERTWRALLYGHAIRRVDQIFRRVADAQSKPYAELRRISEEAENDGISSWNPLVTRTVPSLSKMGGAWLESRARLRLLRAAAHFQATGEVLDLADPFGDKLKNSRTGNTLKLWSLGPDGADNSGDGDWKSANGKDLVLTVKRAP